MDEADDLDVHLAGGDTVAGAADLIRCIDYDFRVLPARFTSPVAKPGKL